MTFYLLGIVFGLFAVAMVYWNKLVVISVLIAFTVIVLSIFFVFATRLPGRLKDRRRTTHNGQPKD